MKQIQKRKNKSKQQQKVKLDSSQIIKLMTAQKQKQEKGSKNFCNLIGMSFIKIPIYKFSPEINQYLQKYNKETTVSFIQCNLTTLEGLNFDGTQVKYLRVDYNSLKGDSLQFIAQHFPNLITLNLKHNQIANLEDLVHLKHLKNLEDLNLSFNPVKKYQDYKTTIFQHLPQLSNLDNEMDTDDSMADTSEDLILQSSEDEESEASFDDYEESSEEDKKQKNKRKKVKK
ncbi:unnamed protein product [Paramecium pentaurelia]|uniref:Leucine rich repeat protein n=1 Tax=Paramecium pentaurelia TaxID=43138 RepID=A0A8S1T5I1_9CILI|nr:unnamed protein product [Paramecium pentaurelia]